MNRVPGTTSACIKSIWEVNIRLFGKLSLLWRAFIECPRCCSLLGDRRRPPGSADEQMWKLKLFNESTPEQTELRIQSTR